MLLAKWDEAEVAGHQMSGTVLTRAGCFSFFILLFFIVVSYRGLETARPVPKATTTGATRARHQAGRFRRCVCGFWEGIVLDNGEGAVGNAATVSRSGTSDAAERMADRERGEEKVKV